MARARLGGARSSLDRGLDPGILGIDLRNALRPGRLDLGYGLLRVRVGVRVRVRVRLRVRVRVKVRVRVRVRVGVGVGVRVSYLTCSHHASSPSATCRPRHRQHS